MNHINRFLDHDHINWIYERSQFPHHRISSYCSLNSFINAYICSSYNVITCKDNHVPVSFRSVNRALSEGGILTGIDPLEDSLSRFLVQATVIIGITRLLALFGAYLKQPRVIFEVIGGIILGPSALGKSSYFLSTIFPNSKAHPTLGYIGLVANIGLVLYLFIVGMELDPKLLLSHAKKAGAVALVGMIVPFGLGVAISKTMYDNLLEPGFAPSFTGFFVFIGSFSIYIFIHLSHSLSLSLHRNSNVYHSISCPCTYFKGKWSHLLEAWSYDHGCRRLERRGCMVSTDPCYIYRKRWSTTFFRSFFISLSLSHTYIK